VTEVAALAQVTEVDLRATPMRTAQLITICVHTLLHAVYLRLHRHPC